MKNKDNLSPHIVIVGGGASGLELAAKLGSKLGKSHKARITLVDCAAAHLWKPLLHEVAAGTLDSNEDEINYSAYANQHHFQFCLGTLQGLNRKAKKITLAAILDTQQHEIVPQRSLTYDVLIIAVGSMANDFNTPGVQEHCLFLDNFSQANYFQQILTQNLQRLAHQKSMGQTKPFTIAVVGGGATGVELTAELHTGIKQLAENGLALTQADVSITLIEASDRLLPVLPPEISALTLQELQRLNIQVLTGSRVGKVSAEGFFIQPDKFIPADMKVWSAGIKAPDFLANLDGLAVNHINQLQVKQTLQTTLDDAIFAMGDCASCPQDDTKQTVPPRAQASHQQASFLVKALQCYFNKKPLPLYHYQDFGSLVSLGEGKTVGSLISKISKNMIIKGRFARLAYLSLYKMHLMALYGPWRVMLLTAINSMTRGGKKRLKLH